MLKAGIWLLKQLIVEITNILLKFSNIYELQEAYKKETVLIEEPQNQKLVESLHLEDFWLLITQHVHFPSKTVYYVSNEMSLKKKYKQNFLHWYFQHCPSLSKSVNDMLFQLFSSYSNRLGVCEINRHSHNCVWTYSLNAVMHLDLVS